MVDSDRDTVARSAAGVPHPALRELVTCYHGYRYDEQAPGVHHGLPSSSLTMVLSFDQPVDVGWLRQPGTRGRHWALASGLHLAPAAIHHDGRQHGIQLDLTPLGARALLGVPAAALLQEIVCLDDILGAAGARLYEEVAAPRTWTARFAALDGSLLALAAGRTAGELGWDQTLRQAWRQLHSTRGRLPIARLAADLGWSRGQLGRRFVRELGVGPKQVSRLVRFGAARDQVASGRSRLAQVASECGYADQAHLTREFRALAGLAPTGWLRQEATFLQDHEAVSGQDRAHERIDTRHS